MCGLWTWSEKTAALVLWVCTSKGSHCQKVRQPYGKVHRTTVDPDKFQMTSTLAKNTHCDLMKDSHNHSKKLDSKPREAEINCFQSH